MPSYVNTAIKMSPGVTCYDILPGIANICADNFACYVTTGEKRVTQHSDHTMHQMVGDQIPGVSWDWLLFQCPDKLW
jgi:hypothetical protein